MPHERRSKADEIEIFRITVPIPEFTKEEKMADDRNKKSGEVRLVKVNSKEKTSKRYDAYGYEIPEEKPQASETRTESTYAAENSTADRNSGRRTDIGERITGTGISAPGHKYDADIRAAIESVDRGQIEAAGSIGMTAWQTLRRIVIPEALVVALPSLGNALINMAKSTSLVYTCAVVDITAGGKLIAGRNYRYFEMYLSLSIIYWIITLVISIVFNILEKKSKVGEKEIVKINDRNKRFA